MSASRGNAFMADQWPFPTARVQQQHTHDYMMAITLSSQMMMTYTSYSLPVNQKQTNAHEVRGHSLVAKDLSHFKIVTKIMFAEKKNTVTNLKYH